MKKTNYLPLIIGAVVLQILAIVIASVVLVASLNGSLSLKKENNNQADNSKNSSDLYDAGCVTMGKLNSNAGVDVKFTSTSKPGKTCSFIVQYEGLGDTPIAVGEVFIGDYSWQEKADFIPDSLADGYELDILNLGLLRTGKGDPMLVTDKKEIQLDSGRAIIFRHESNRSISRSAYSAVVEPPTGSTIDGQPMSCLFIWGVDNQTNSGQMEKLVRSISWK
ncbi:hypothetical protein KC930_01420 [Candidatus Saccharibacteria bacterium]|nr:hypothetical protein [Candidatus Saccharibacteria bacterium]